MSEHEELTFREQVQPGDAVVWYYTNDGSTSLPDLDDVVTDPDAPRPSYDAMLAREPLADWL